MKSGIAAAVEALRILRETELLPAGGILFTAHDLHEGPWQAGQLQLAASSTPATSATR